MDPLRARAEESSLRALSFNVANHDDLFWLFPKVNILLAMTVERALTGPTSLM